MDNTEDTALVLADRPPSGTAGKPYEAVVNCFYISPPTTTFFHYDVILPTEKHVRRRHEIINELQSQVETHRFNPRAVYDGSANLFAFYEVLDDGLVQMTFAVNTAKSPPPADNPTRGQFKVTLTKVREIPQSALENILAGRGRGIPITTTPLQVLNVLVQQACKLSRNFVSFSRQASFTERQCRTHKGLEIWPGIFTSVRPAKERLIVNVDTVTAVMFQHGPLADTVMSYFGARNSRFLSQMDISTWLELKKFLKDLRIQQAPTGRFRTVCGIIARAGFHEFTRDGQLVTVKEYFKEDKNIVLKHPGWPGIVTAREEIIPFELCSVPLGHRYRRRLSPEMTAMVLDFTKKRPDKRFAAITTGMQRLVNNSSPYISQAGMRIESNPIHLLGRLLRPPDILYNGSATVPQNGTWKVRGNRLWDPQRIFSWGIASFDPTLPLPVLETFAFYLVYWMKTLGLLIADETPPIQIHNAGGDIAEALWSVGNAALNSKSNVAKLKPDPSRPPTFILVVLPGVSPEIRKAVKQWGDIEIGVPTQCVIRENVQTFKDRTLQQLCLKINARLGGVNFVPRNNETELFKKQKTMVIGIDVAHPGPGIQRPSVAGVVASVDNYAAQYVATTSIQPPRVEIVQDLKRMLTRVIPMFNEYRSVIAKKANAGIWPERLIIFRDGVSEGELQFVVDSEFRQVKEAIEECWSHKNTPPKLNKPKVTYIVVGKRHHIRFKPRVEGNGDESGNCPAGFVVDNTITSPGVFDFYLQSHAGLLGTSKSSHYIVVKDENEFSSDSLQALCFTLCHTYARATRSVSIPAPVYYADIVCSRADFHFRPDLNFMNDDSSSGGERNESGKTFDMQKWKNGYAPIHKNHIRKMYFI